jgi:hypothetical protein
MTELLKLDWEATGREWYPGNSKCEIRIVGAQ